MALSGTLSPVSSSVSRKAQSSGVSPASRAPPGKSHNPGYGNPSQPEACRSIQLQVAAARREAVRKGLDENHLFLPKEVRPQVARFIDLLHEASHEFELATSLGREDLRAKDAMRRARRVVEREAPTIEVAVRRCFGPTIQPQFPVVSNDC